MPVLELTILGIHITKHTLEVGAAMTGVGAVAGAAIYGGVSGYKNAKDGKAIKVVRNGLYVVVTCGAVMFSASTDSVRSAAVDDLARTFMYTVAETQPNEPTPPLEKFLSAATEAKHQAAS